MNRIELHFITILAFCAMLTALGQPTFGRTITKISTKPQYDYNQQLDVPKGPVITKKLFDFSDRRPFVSISELQLTFTMSDGDTGIDPEGTDYNDLAMSLDSLSPSGRWLMNGFPNDPNRGANQTTWDPEYVTNTFTLDVTDEHMFENALLKEVGPGGDQRLRARIWDLDADVTAGKNRIRFSEKFDAELQITGAPTPEPSTTGLALVALAVGGGALLVHKRSESSN